MLKIEDYPVHGLNDVSDMESLLVKLKRSFWQKQSHYCLIILTDVGEIECNSMIRCQVQSIMHLIEEVTPKSFALRMVSGNFK